MQSPSQIYTIGLFAVGDRVRHREWTVPATGPQEPRIERRTRTITRIDGQSIYCGRNEYRAFELIPV